jgi:hypothetical protein
MVQLSFSDWCSTAGAVGLTSSVTPSAEVERDMASLSIDLLSPENWYAEYSLVADVAGGGVTGERSAVVVESGLVRLGLT